MDEFYSGLRCIAVSPLQPTGREVTAAPGKPIAPSGEPGDKLMPLLKSVAHHVRVRSVV